MNDAVNYDTDTSKWAIAVHRVGTTTAEVWVGTLYPTMKMPLRARVRLESPDGRVRTRTIRKPQWKRPFRKTDQRFYTVVTFKSLLPDTAYKLRFDRFVEASGDIIDARWQALRNACFETLPARLPAANERPFTIGIGSCFYDHRDGGQAAGAYQALYERGAPKQRPHVTFLTGDQVYLDIGFDSLSWDENEIRQRIADDYAQHWRSLGGILNRGGTWLLPDDHEYWNDYPFYDSLIPQLLALKIDKVREAWAAASKDAVRNVQRSPVVETLAIGDDLSICFADLRSHRSKTQFLPNAEFEKLADWAEALDSPGVLVVPQPLIVENNEVERNLRSFPGQYGRLVRALGASGHDVVLLSGDVHFGRIATCKLGTNGGRLIEIVSSPLSNLTYLNGIATAKPRHVPTHFPGKDFTIPGSFSHRVRYASHFDVSTKNGRLFSAYPKDRTREHFMTVGFRRSKRGRVLLSAHAWRVRERGDPRNTPVPDFAKPFLARLR